MHGTLLTTKWKQHTERKHETNWSASHSFLDLNVLSSDKELKTFQILFVKRYWHPNHDLSMSAWHGVTGWSGNFESTSYPGTLWFRFAIWPMDWSFVLREAPTFQKESETWANLYKIQAHLLGDCRMSQLEAVVGTLFQSHNRFIVSTFLRPHKIFSSDFLRQTRQLIKLRGESVHTVFASSDLLTTSIHCHLSLAVSVVDWWYNVLLFRCCSFCRATLRNSSSESIEFV